MILQGQVGIQSNSDGSFADVRQDRQGGVVVSELNPRYYENTFRSQKFSACNTAAVTVGALTATNVTFALYNPPNSGKNFVIAAANFAPSSGTITAGAVFYAYNQQTTTPLGATALTVRSNLLTGNNAASVAQVYSAATLSATPIAVRPFFGVTSTANAAILKDDVGGELVLAPGGVLSIQGNTASIVQGFVGISWDEISQ